MQNTASWNAIAIGTVHSYFFAITDTGEGIVFHSPTTNGGKMYLKPTDNKELQEEFTQLLHQ